MSAESDSLLPHSGAPDVPHRSSNKCLLVVATFAVLGVNVLVCGPLPGIISLQAPLTSRGLMSDKCPLVYNSTTNTTTPPVLPCREQLEAFERVADLSLSIMNLFCVVAGLLNDMMGPTLAVASLFLWSAMSMVSGVDSDSGLAWQICTTLSGVCFAGPSLASFSVFAPQWFPQHVELMNAITTGLWDVGGGFAVIQGIFIDEVDVSVFQFYLGIGLMIGVPFSIGWMVVFFPDLKVPSGRKAVDTLRSSREPLLSRLYIVLAVNLVVNVTFVYYYVSIFPTMLRWHGEHNTNTVKEMTQVFIAVMAVGGAATSFGIGVIIHRLGTTRGCLLCMCAQPVLIVALCLVTIFGGPRLQYVGVAVFVMYRMSVFTIFNSMFYHWFGQFSSVGFCMGLAYGLAGAVSAVLGHVLIRTVQDDRSHFPYVLAGMMGCAVASYIGAIVAVYNDSKSNDTAEERAHLNPT